MRATRLLNWFFILIMLFTPVLSACQRSQPAPSAPPASAAQQAAAPATQPAAPTPEPSAIPSPTPTRAPLPPIVVKVTPETGEEQRLTQPVVLTFDQPMDPSTTQAAFSIQPNVEGQVKVQGAELVFTPAQPLKRAAQYVVSVKESAASAAGLKLGQPVSLKIATVGFLEVTNNQPADKASDVPVNAKITVGFNRPVVPLTGIKEQVQLPAPLIITPSLTGKSEWLNTGIYQFTPDKGFSAATNYTVTVKAGLQDTTGGLLDGDYTFGFRTTDPTVLSWLPENTSNFKVESPISITFSMPMDPASTEAAFVLSGPNKAAVTGTFSWNQDHTQLGFRPEARLSFGANYVATLAKAARPANGQGTLREQAVHQFSTVYTPRIIKTEPADKATADPFDTVTFHFASPMDQRSFITGTYTILPKPTQVFTGYNDESTFFLNFDKLPATAYTVTLSGKLADPYGNTLGQNFVLHFTTRDYKPLLQLNSPGTVGTYNAYTKTQAIVTYVNVPEILFQLYKVPQADFIALTGRAYWEKWQSYSPGQANLVREWRVKTPAARNETGFLRTDLTDKDGKQLPPGNYWLDISGSGFSIGDKIPSNFRQLLARTDLNVTLKTEQEGALAWVTDLKSGLPAEGIKVRFTDAAKLDQEATTDKDGIARIVFNAAHQSYDQLTALAVGDNGQFGVASNMWEDGINAWSFNLPGGGLSPAYNGYVYTDRAIYRPNQTVYWKAVIRRDNDAVYSLPAAGQPVSVTIRDDQGNELLKQKMTLDPLGTLDGKFALGQEAALGYYNITVQLPGDPQIKDVEGPSFGVGFQVAEYRKPEYEISAETDKPEYVQGQEIKVTAQAGYYFGGPVKNGQVHWVLSSVDYGFQYVGKGNYSWMDWDWYDQPAGPRFGGALSQGDGRTDAQGRFTFSVPADVGKFTQSQHFTFDITVTDLNNQAVSTQAGAVVHKGAFYIGLQPQSYVAAVGEKNRVDVLTVDPQSRPAPHTDVTVIANQVEWYSVREQAEDGRYYWTSKARLTPVFTQTLTTDNQGSALFEWTPQKGGEYKIAAAGRDMAGHAIRSAAYVWVSDSSYVLWRQDNNDRIQLVANKDQYAVGEEAELLVASPYQTPVKALLTVERNHVLTYQVIELKGNSDTLRIPIKADYAPDVFVSIVLVKGMDRTSPAPTFKIGLAQLKVSVADKVLSVVVKPETSTGQAASGSGTAGAEPLHVGPRDTVTWTVKTLDAAGQPVKASVSLALIDKAILSLASDQAGTLLDRFYSQRALGVRTASTLVVNVDRIVAQLTKGGKGGGGGGGGGAGALSVRTEFPDIAFWKATVQTDATGTAQVAVTLPDNLTTWTMDARAVTPDTLVGQSQTDIIATKDLLVRPVLPRFLVEGDQAEIAAIVHNNTNQPLETTIQFKLTGLEPAGGATNQATVATVAAGGTYKAVRPVKVQANVEQVKVQISAAGGTLSDVVETTLPVYRYTTPEVTGTSGQVAQDESRLELVRLPADADPTRGQLDVTIEPSLAAGMTGGLSYLEHFPYECIEQTISRFLPNVTTYRALSKLGISQPDLQAKLGQQVGVALQRIYGQQHLDGGWGWWQSDESNAWTSAYVVYGLARAKEAGFTVDQAVLDRGLHYLESTLKAPNDLSNWELNRQAFIVYALAVAGDLQPNRAGGLYEVREKLSLYSKGYLALALGLIKDNASAGRIKTLLADLNGRAITSATSTHWEEGWTDYWNMNTDTRSTSIVLDVLATLDPQNSLAPNAVRWLMVARNGDRWQTTQENAWAIMALTDWMAASGELQGNYSWKVLLNDQALGQGSVTPDSVREPAQLHADVAQLLLDQTNGLLIQRSATGDQTGKGQLYYTAHLKTYLPVEKLQPVDRGVVVSREYRMADCVNPPVVPAGDQTTEQEREKTCPTVTQARVGDVISVKLNIVVPHSLYYVVVEDPLPAGTEAVDTSLLTTSTTAQGPQMQKTPDQSNKSPYSWDGWWTPTHTELRDEKVAMFATSLAPGAYQFTYQIRASVPGQFLTLPPTGYEMYFPEVWGRGAGSLFTVTE